MANTQPQPRAGYFGGEKGMKELGNVFFGNSASGVPNGNRDHFLLEEQLLEEGALAFSANGLGNQALDQARLQENFAALGSGLDRVQNQV